jgi:hypothetical protein
MTMAAYKKNTSFISDEHVQEVHEELEEMERDSAFNTESSFSPNVDLYPDNRMPFVDKHMQYLMSHRGIDPNQYLSNLRLMTRIR